MPLLDPQTLQAYGMGLLNSGGVSGVAPSPNIGDTFDERFSAGLPTVPLPRPRPAQAGAQLPIAASPTMAEMPQTNNAPPQSSAPPPVPGSSFLGRLGSVLGNNSNTLLALGAGMAGAPSLGTGLSRGFAAAIPASQRDLQLRVMNQTAQALINRQVPPDLALMIATNPSAMQQMLPRLLGQKQYQPVTLKTASGGQRIVLVDAVSGTVFDPSTGQTTGGQGISGVPGGLSGQAPAGGASVPNPKPGSINFDNFDWNQVNSNLSGNDYLAQFSPEIQSAAKAYMTGGVMPTGNPRNNGVAAIAKNIAQKYAMDLGRPELADDTLYPQRRQMQVELGKTTMPSSVGGQITFGGTAIGHLATYAETLAKLGNWGGLGFAPLAGLENKARGLNTQQTGAIQEAQGEGSHYGQEIAKFYGGGQTGEAERLRFENKRSETASGPELAGIIRAERDLIPERFEQIHANISNVLGPEAADKAVARIQLAPQMQRINAALAKLDPTGPEARALQKTADVGAPPAAPAVPAAPGLPQGWSVQVH